MAYHEGKIVIADRNLNQAVRNALSGNIEPERRNFERGRNSMSDGSDAVGVEVENVGYNSYFKIVDRTETSANGTKTFKIQVVDGGGRGINRFKVNNRTFTIGDSEKISISTTPSYIFLHCTFKNDSLQTSEYVIYTSADNRDNATNSYYLIGEVRNVKGEFVIYQDHRAGVAQLFWYNICGE